MRIPILCHCVGPVIIRFTMRWATDDPRGGLDLNEGSPQGTARSIACKNRNSNRKSGFVMDISFILFF